MIKDDLLWLVMFEYKHPWNVQHQNDFDSNEKLITCNVCVATSEYCRVGTGVVLTGCLGGSGSVLVAVEDCCLSLFGDNCLAFEGGGGGGGTMVGISIGIVGKSERAGEISVRLAIYLKYTINNS